MSKIRGLVTSFERTYNRRVYMQVTKVTAFTQCNLFVNSNYSLIIHQIINLEEPYETKCKNKKLKSSPTYTKVGCISECLAEKLVRTCQCRPAEYEGWWMNMCYSVTHSELKTENIQRTKIMLDVSWDIFPWELMECFAFNLAACSYACLLILSAPWLFIY